MNQPSKIDWLQDFIEKMIDEIISHYLDEIKRRVQKFKLKYRNLPRRQIAQKIVEDQSFWGGLLAVPGGLGGLVVLPFALPVDMVKYLRVQAYMIFCLIHLYEYPLNDHGAMKTDLFLLMSHSSIDQLKNFVCSEAQKQVKNDFAIKQALINLKKIDSYKDMGKKAVNELGVKYGTQVAMRLGEKQLMNHTLRSVPKIFRGIIWRLGGRKIAEKTLQKTAGRIVPILGAVVAGGMDWWMIKETGKLAIEYYEMGGPDFLDAAYTLIE
ncbi:hypothetical protein [Spirulina subsalsa]|uniref:hypothetical protein n=1 Tax=Spirulina subsalsa TaxID=54311 RepID=UPI0002DE68FC|nr:hypothetical protein [Spirulina subsalsa]